VGWPRDGETRDRTREFRLHRTLSVACRASAGARCLARLHRDQMVPACFRAQLGVGEAPAVL